MEMINQERIRWLERFKVEFPPIQAAKPREIESYIGIEPFTVEIDSSPTLDTLVREAKKLKGLPFEEKLKRLKEIATGAMVNAYELMIAGRNDQEKELGRDIVLNQHPLSYALDRQAGCCRYQGALFFALGYEAELGDKHLLQAAPVGNGVSSVFNDIIQGSRLMHVSIFLESLKDKHLDYSRQNPKVFEQAFRSIPGIKLYSYSITPRGYVLTEESER